MHSDIPSESHLGRGQMGRASNEVQLAGGRIGYRGLSGGIF